MANLLSRHHTPTVTQPTLQPQYIRMGPWVVITLDAFGVLSRRLRVAILPAEGAL